MGSDDRTIIDLDEEGRAPRVERPALELSGQDAELLMGLVEEFCATWGRSGSPARMAHLARMLGQWRGMGGGVARSVMRVEIEKPAP